jgi:Cell division protein CrgA
MPESKSRKTKKPRRPPTPRPTAASIIKEKGPSPRWYVILMLGLMGVGLLSVLSRFVFQLPQYWLLGGLAAIAAGFIMTTNYR